MGRRLVPFVLALALLAPPLGATWSIVLVDTATGEVAVGSATCLEGFNLEQFVPVVVVGHGAAAAQAQIDMGGTNKLKIRNELLAGTPPTQILAIIKQGDIFKASRQYGIVDLSPAAAGFTGGAVMQFKAHRVGMVGTISYAIQGNILTGLPVIDAAELAIQNSTGILSDRLMAGMIAARQMGGDGRCSCPTGGAQSCGSPPPQFLKSAHVGFMIVARMGDTDGPCSGGGCATGDYWMNLNVSGQLEQDPDPVDQLRALYAGFVDSMAGQPDGVRSFQRLSSDQVVGDGTSLRELRVSLYDLRGRRIETGGASLSVSHAEGSAGLSSVVGVTDHGNGTYTIELQAGLGAGTDVLAVKVGGGPREATLYPYLTLDHHAPPVARSGDARSGDARSRDARSGNSKPGAGAPAIALRVLGAMPGRVWPFSVVITVGDERPPGASWSLWEARLPPDWIPPGLRSHAASVAALRITP